MAQAPHDKTGRVCSEESCKTPFTKNSYFGSIIKKNPETGLIEQRIVCRRCHNDHFSKGE